MYGVKNDFSLQFYILEVFSLKMEGFLQAALSYYINESIVAEWNKLRIVYRQGMPFSETNIQGLVYRL